MRRLLRAIVKLHGAASSADQNDEEDAPDQQTMMAHALARLEFLKAMQVALDDRRKAVDQRVTIIVTIALAQAAFLLSQGGALFRELPVVAQVVAMAGCLPPAILTLVYAVRLAVPIRRPRNQRTSIPAGITWFYGIARMNYKDYVSEVRKRKIEGIEEEFSTIIVDVSRLLARRYSGLIRTGRMLVTSLALTTAMVSAAALYGLAR